MSIRALVIASLTKILHKMNLKRISLIRQQMRQFFHEKIFLHSSISMPIELFLLLRQYFESHWTRTFFHSGLLCKCRSITSRFMNEYFPLTFENHKNILLMVFGLRDKIAVRDFTLLFRRLPQRMPIHI